ncbi:MAG: extracellular solute-binding protein, partial [Pseudonocardiaceae bacterium]
MAPTTTQFRLRLGRSAPLALSLLLAAGLAAACGGTTAPASAAPGPTITLYNAQHEQTTNAMIAAFTKQTGIKVRVDNDDEDVLTAKVEQEGNRSPADVIYTENSNWLQQLDNRGLLAKVNPATLSDVPKPDSATDGDWAGVSARMSVLIYNPSKLNPAQLPHSVMDLADPQWKGKIEISPSETDFWPIVSSIARAKGQAATVAWLKALKANAGANDNVPDNETIASDVSQGTTDLAVINHYYFYRLQAEVGKGSVNA